jgi:hypothetical protein
MSKGADAMVHDAVTQVLRENGKAVPVLVDDLRLDGDLGLSSLDVTTVLTRLTAGLAKERAEQMMAGADIATVGDLRRAFRGAFDGGASSEREELAASRRRAEARRAASR